MSRETRRDIRDLPKALTHNTGARIKILQLPSPADGLLRVACSIGSYAPYCLHCRCPTLLGRAVATCTACCRALQVLVVCLQTTCLCPATVCECALSP